MNLTGSLNITNSTNITGTMKIATANKYDLAVPNIIGMSFIAYFISVLASVAGIGGSESLIAFYALASGLQLKDVAILSSLTIAGNSLVRALFFSFSKHQDAPNRFVPNYEIAIILTIFETNTSYIGYVLNQISPHILIVIVYGIIAIILTTRVVIEIVRYFRNRSSDDNSMNTVVYDNIELNIDSQLNNEQSVRKGDKVMDVVNSYAIIFLSFAMITFFTYIRTIINAWIIYAVQFVLVSLFGYISITYIRINYKLKRKQQFNFIPSDVQWNDKIAILKYVGIGTLNGILISMLGMGGASINNPLLLHFGLAPLVISASSGVITFFTSTTSVIQYSLTSNLFEWYFILLFGLGALASVTSIILIRFMKKNIKIIIICILGILLVASFIIILVTNSINFVQHGIN